MSNLIRKSAACFARDSWDRFYPYALALHNYCKSPGLCLIFAKYPTTDSLLLPETADVGLMVGSWDVVDGHDSFPPSC